MRFAGAVAALFVAALLAGLALARGLNGALDVRFQEKRLPEGFPLAPADAPSAGARAGSASAERSFGPLPWRLVGPGSVGIERDPAHWGRDYAHHSGAFRHVVLKKAPWIDHEAFAAVEADWRRYLERMRAYGFNAVVFKAFLELVTFEEVGDGRAVYAEGSPWRARHRVLRRHYRRLFRTAHDLGMRVVLGSDMVALTPPLRRYMASLPGGLDSTRPAMWEVYRAGLEELLREVPEADGFLIRIGEAGSVYNLPGWDYRSELWVRDAEAVRRMLRSLLPPLEARGKPLFFRSWSVGVGEIGAMHTDPETYERVLGAIDSPSLVVSTKLVRGDFYSYLPWNPTLRRGRHRRIVEMQARREFEGFGAFPNYLASHHGRALRSLLASNPRIEGLWLWPQRGGPLRAGPYLLYPFAGTGEWVDASVHATGRLARDPEARPEALAREWAEGVLGADPEAARALAEVLLRSREPVLRGLYVGPFARRAVRALGLEPPPQLWIFEWDLVAGASSVLSAVHHVARDELEAAIAEGHEAVGGVEALRDRLASVAERVAERETHARLLASLDYQRDLFETLARWREAFLPYYEWLRTGDAGWRARAERGLDRFEARLAEHRERYGDDLAHPAYNFLPVEAALDLMRRDGAAIAGARLWLAALALALGAGLLAHRRRRRSGRPGGALALFAAGALAPRALDPGRAGAGAGLGAALLVLGLPVAALAVFTSYGPAWLVAALALPAAVQVGATATLAGGGGASASARLAASAPLSGLAAVGMGVCALRGPLYLWARFWVDPAFRTGLVVALTLAAAGLLVAQHLALRALRGSGALDALGRAALAAGAAGTALALELGLPGLEHALTAANDELALLPLGLSRILGITTHLGIPPGLPWALLGGAAGLAALGAGVAALAPERRRGAGGA